MKFLAIILFTTLTLGLFSCSDNETVVEYNEEDPPVVELRLTRVAQPYSTSLPSFPGQELTYDAKKRIAAINMYQSSLSIRFIYSDDSIVGIVKSNTLTEVTNDTLYYVLTNRNRVKYATLALDKKRNAVYTENGNHRDSISFSYNAGAYLEKMAYFSKDEKYYREIYSQKYTIEDGNFQSLEMMSGDMYRFVYDDNTHTDASELCYDMPKMLHQFSAYNPFALTLPAIYNYLGTKSKNNVVKIKYEWGLENTVDRAFYNRISYWYKYNAADMLTSISMSGNYLLTGDDFDGGVTLFNYSPYELPK